MKVSTLTQSCGPMGEGATGELTKTCSAGLGGSGDGIKSSGSSCSTACSFDLGFLAVSAEAGEKARNDKRSRAVTLPAEVHVSPPPVFRRRIMLSVGKRVSRTGVIDDSSGGEAIITEIEDEAVGFKRKKGRRYHVSSRGRQRSRRERSD